MTTFLLSKEAHDEYRQEKEAEIKRLKKEHQVFVRKILEKNAPMRPCVRVE